MKVATTALVHERTATSWRMGARSTSATASPSGVSSTRRSKLLKRTVCGPTETSGQKSDWHTPHSLAVASLRHRIISHGYALCSSIAIDRGAVHFNIVRADTCTPSVA